MPRIISSILGLAAASPIVGLLLVAIFLPVFVPAFEQIEGPLSSESLRLIFGLLGLVTMGLFISMALSSSFVPADKKKLWVALLLFGNFFVLPFFWYWYVRPNSGARA